jgi:hypothetical protein
VADLLDDYIRAVTRLLDVAGVAIAHWETEQLFPAAGTIYTEAVPAPATAAALLDAAWRGWPVPTTGQPPAHRQAVSAEDDEADELVALLRLRMGDADA